MRRCAMLADARARYRDWVRSEVMPQLQVRGFKRRGAGWSRDVDGNALVVLLEARSPTGVDVVEVRVSYGAISAIGSPVEADSKKMPSSVDWTIQFDVKFRDDGSPWEVTDAASLEDLRVRLLPELLARIDELGRGGTTDAHILQVLRFGKTAGSSEFLKLLSSYRIASALHDSDAAEWAANGVRRIWSRTRSWVFRDTIEAKARLLGISLSGPSNGPEGSVGPWS